MGNSFKMGCIVVVSLVVSLGARGVIMGQANKERIIAEVGCCLSLLSLNLYTASLSPQRRISNVSSHSYRPRAQLLKKVQSRQYVFFFSL